MSKTFEQKLSTKVCCRQKAVSKIFGKSSGQKFSKEAVFKSCEQVLGARVVNKKFEEKQALLPLG